MKHVVALALLLTACGPSAAGSAPPIAYPGELTPPSELRSPLGEAFALDQRVVAESQEGTHEFRAVLQLQGDTLTMVGLGPHGGRGFVLTERGREVELESHLPEELPFPPRFMMLDVQRVWFRGLDGPLPDGEHEGVVDGDEVRERWEGGRLRERTFQRQGGEPPGVIRVVYEGGLGSGEPPTVVRYENGWLGYTLTLTTLAFQPIEATSGGEAGSDD